MEDEKLQPLHLYLRTLRINGNVRQDALARRLGMDNALLCNYESGARQLPEGLAGRYIDAVRDIAREAAKAVGAVKQNAT